MDRIISNEEFEEYQDRFYVLEEECQACGYNLSVIEMNYFVSISGEIYRICNYCLKKLYQQNQ